MTNHLKSASWMLLFITVPGLLMAQVDREENFYTPPETCKLVKDLRHDYRVDNSFETDDSAKLQQAIEEVSRRGGGRIVIPSGDYCLANVILKSNVHLELDAGVTIRPPVTIGKTNKGTFRSYVVFGLPGEPASPVENVSVAGQNGSFTVDLRGCENPGSRVVSIQHAKNFMIANMRVEDDYSKFSAVVLNGANGAENGIVKNIHVSNADYGYGVVQMQTGVNILFKNLYGKGGATLRFESHNHDLRDTGNADVIDRIVARDIRSECGNAAIMLSPHFVTNGTVDLENITAIGSGFAVRIENGFTTKEEAALGLKPGSFDSRTSLRNVKAVFSETGAQLKSKHYKYMPLDLQKKVSKSPIRPGGKSFHGPSIAVVVYDCNYTIDFDDADVTQADGFRPGQRVVRNARD